MSDDTPLPTVTGVPPAKRPTLSEVLGHDCEWEDGGTIVVHKNGDVHFVDDPIGSHDEVAKDANKAEGKSPADKWREVDIEDGEWQDVGSGDEDPAPGCLPMVRSYSLEIDDCEDPVVLEAFKKDVKATLRRISAGLGPSAEAGPAKRRKSGKAGGAGAAKI